MTEEEALVWLGHLVSADTVPILDAPTLLLILHEARRIDEYGRIYTDADWIPTYNFNKAAARGWEIKAGKCSDLFNFSSDVNSFQRQQIYQHCIEMSQRYSRGIFGSISMARRKPYDPVIGNLND